MTNTEYLRARLLRNVIDTPVGDKTASLEEIYRFQWSEEFINLMRPRMAMGMFRYGEVRKQAGTYDNIGSAIQRLELFQIGGNEEHLIDVPNLCMVEFIQKNHPNVHFNAVDDGIHVEKIK